MYLKIPGFSSLNDIFSECLLVLSVLTLVLIFAKTPLNDF